MLFHFVVRQTSHIFSSMTESLSAGTQSPPHEPLPTPVADPLPFSPEQLLWIEQMIANRQRQSSGDGPGTSAALTGSQSVVPPSADPPGTSGSGELKGTDAGRQQPYRELLRISLVTQGRYPLVHPRGDSRICRQSKGKPGILASPHLWLLSQPEEL